MNKILTIAIPAYQVENYIIKCVESITEIAGRERLDVLVIDDGSTDRTGALADELALKYPECVRVIHQENKGHGGAVNTGICEAEGYYFKVVDGDDWVDQKALEELVSCLEKAEEDVLFHDYSEVYEKTGRKKEFSLPLPVSRTFEIGELKHIDHMSMHVYVYKTKLLKSLPIRLDEHCYYVDLEYSLYPVRWAKTFRYEPLPVCFYRLEREGQSASPEGFRKHVKEHERVLFSLVNFYKMYCENNENLSKKYLTYQVADRYLRHILKCCRYLNGKNGAVSRYLRTVDAKMKDSSPYLYDYLLQEESRRGSLSNLQLRSLRVTGFRIWPLVRLKWKIMGK